MSALSSAISTRAAAEAAAEWDAAGPGGRAAPEVSGRAVGSQRSVSSTWAPAPETVGAASAAGATEPAGR